MLYAFGFERVGVVVGDLYFDNPRAARGQDGAEHGVRLELRMLERGALKGSAYSARPIEIGHAVWRGGQLRPHALPPRVRRLESGPPGLRERDVRRPVRLARRPPGRPGRPARLGRV